jgi:hypothetical protein
MQYQFFFLLFLGALFLPGANAQLTVSYHNITYELGEDIVIVEERILFKNPAESEIHTFDEDIGIIREHLDDIMISGVSATIDNNTFPFTITLEFSNSPIFRPPTWNTREVTISYSIKEPSGEAPLSQARRLFVFSGNVLQPLPSDLQVEETHIKMRLFDGYQFGIVLPEADPKNNEITYFMSKDDRKVFSAFNVETQYARFKDEANSNIKVVKETLAEAEGKIEDAQSAILNAIVYDANTSGAMDELNNSRALVNESRQFLAIAQALLDRRDFYSAYIVTNTSLNLSERALSASINAERESNLQLRIALNEKIQRLENLSTAVTTPSPALPVEEEEIERGRPQTTTPPLTPTVTPAPPEEILEPVKEEASRKGVYAIIIIIFIAGSLLLLRTRGGKGRKGRQAAVKDFRSIADLKRKSYKDFEEKVVDVKKETSIAGEIRKLQREKGKYELGIENLNKKKLSGEIDEKVYSSEKKNFESHIKRLDKKIYSLEKELAKKGELNEESESD